MRAAASPLPCPGELPRGSAPRGLAVPRRVAAWLRDHQARDRSQAAKRWLGLRCFRHGTCRAGAALVLCDAPAEPPPGGRECRPIGVPVGRRGSEVLRAGWRSANVGARGSTGETRSETYDLPLVRIVRALNYCGRANRTLNPVLLLAVSACHLMPWITVASMSFCSFAEKAVGSSSTEDWTTHKMLLWSRGGSCFLFKIWVVKVLI